MVIRGCVRVIGGAIGGIMSMDWDIFVDFVPGLD